MTEQKAPSVTLEAIENEIASEHFFTAAEAVSAAYDDTLLAYDDTLPQVPKPLELLTICVLVLRNGFIVTGESACVSPENFDFTLGCTIARRKAVDKIWPLMGYHLQQRLHDEANDRGNLP